MTPAAFLECALAYAAAGFPVLPLYGIAQAAPPDVAEGFRLGTISKKEAMAYARCACGKPTCPSPGKHPLNHDGATGASLDPDQIRAWWSRWPTANIGLRMPPGVAAIDFDIYVPGVPERLRAFQAEQPLTLVQSSGAGGEHWLYHLPADMTPGTSLDGQAGVDIIHHGHRYIVAEPSVHWTGGAYTWAAAPELRAIAKAPPALVARCQRGARLQSAPSASPYAGVRAYRPGETPSPCPPGIDPMDWAAIVARRLPPAVADGEQGGHEHGHVTLARAAAHLIGGLRLAPADAVAVLWEHFNPRCVPPWDADAEGKDGFQDFERTVLAAGRDVTEPGWLLPQPPPTAPEPPADVPALRGILATMGSLADRTQTPPPLQWRVQDVIAPGKVSILVGPPEAGKGPLALWMSLSVALGRDVLPGRWQTEQCTVIYADSETGSLAEERDVRMCNALGVDRPSVPLEFLHLDDVFSVEMLGKLDAACRCPGVGMLVIDTYGSTLPGDVEHNDAAFSHWLKQLGKLSRNTGATVLVIMHAKKGTTNGPELELISGHYSAAGAAQSVIALRADGQDIEVRCARHPRKKWPPFRIRWTDVDRPTAGTSPYAGVTLDGVSWGLRPEIAPEKPTTEEPERITAKDRNKQEHRQRLDAARRRIMDMFETRQLYNATKTEIVRECADRNAARYALEELVSGGFLTGDVHGGYRLPPGPVPLADRFRR